MIDLDTELRSMFQTRATDIADTPTFSFADESIGDLRRVQFGRPPRRGWLLAAVAAAVLAVAGVTVAVSRGGHSSRPVPPASVSPTKSAPVPTQTGHAPRAAGLAWFGMKPLPGYRSLELQSDVGFRSLGVRATSDSGTPIGCNGCEMASAFIYVIDKGRFDAGAHGVLAWQQAPVGSINGYLGSLQEYNGAKHTVPTLAWEYAPDSWALVQGVTAAGGTLAALHTVAAAVEPTVDVALRLPFTLGFVPDLPFTSAFDDRSEGYSYDLLFGSTKGRSFEINISPNPGVVAQIASNQVSVGGLPGYYDPQQGVADVAIHGAHVEIGFAEADGAPATERDRADLQKVLAGVRWTNGDGQAPFVTAEQAIP